MISRGTDVSSSSQSENIKYQTFSFSTLLLGNRLNNVRNVGLEPSNNRVEGFLPGFQFLNPHHHRVTLLLLSYEEVKPELHLRVGQSDAVLGHSLGDGRLHLHRGLVRLVDEVGDLLPPAPDQVPD